MKRAVALVAAAALATVGLAATATPASAVPVPNTLQLSNNDVPGVLKTGTQNSVLAASVADTCDPAATRYRLRVTAATATDPAAQSTIAPWVGKFFIAPIGAGLPGPFNVSAGGTWQQISERIPVVPIVPGTYEFAFECTNNLGSVIYEEYLGDSVTFTSPTAWQVNDFPEGPVLVDTTTTVEAAPASVSTGENVTLTATVGESDPGTPTGTVAFSVNGGTPVDGTVDAAGVATAVVVAGAAGTANVEAVYSGDTVFNTSTGSTTFSVAGAPASETTSTLTIDPAAPTAGSPVALNGVVANSGDPAVFPVGTCEFLDGTAILGTAPVAADGTCSISRTFAAGDLNLSLNFVPTDPAVFVASSSAPVAVTVGPRPPVEPGDDEQTVIVEIPVGQIIINTPYTPEAPLNLGTAVLNAEGTFYSASAPFDDVTVIDTRAGNPGWSAFIDREDFTNGTGGTIPALNSGFENVTPAYIAGNAITSIAVNDVPANALTAGPERFAQAAAGAGTGTVDIDALFTLEDVSTSTPAGNYTATVVFTVG